MSAPCLLEARALCVGRPARPAVSHLDFSIHAGERWALLGPNGCGKSTLLRTLAGLLPPLGGELIHRPGPLPRGVERVRRVGVLLQEEGAAPFTVRELVTLGLGLDGPPPPAQLERVQEALAAGALQALGGRACAALSGGELQRARLARATVSAPRLLLLDEPTNHLDPARRAQLLAQLSQLPEEAALVLCTHDLSLAAGCSHALLLGAARSGPGGRLVALGDSSTVLTSERLQEAFGVAVQRREDPEGGAPWFRVREPALAPARHAAAPRARGAGPLPLGGRS